MYNQTSYSSGSCLYTKRGVSRCTGAIFAAAVTLTVGAHGTMRRTSMSSFSNVLSFGFGVANPRAFTAYFLPYQVSEELYSSNNMVESVSLIPKYTEYIGNQRLHRQHFVGQLLADDPFLCLPRIQRPSDLSARQRRVEWICLRASDSACFPPKGHPNIEPIRFHASQVWDLSHGRQRHVALAGVAKHVSGQHHGIFSQ